MPASIVGKVLTAALALLCSAAIARGRVKGETFRFTAGLDEYTGRMRGKRITGEVSGATSGRFTATR